jgi:hypothetical protein
MDWSNTSFDILLKISKNLPSKDAVSCSMVIIILLILYSFKVCKNWKNKIDTHLFWIQYFKFHNYSTDPTSLQQLYKLPLSKLKKIVAKGGFNRNLLDDDYSKEKPIIDKRWSDYKKKRGV